MPRKKAAVLKFTDTGSQQKELELVTADFGQDVMNDIRVWVDETLRNLKSAHTDLHENKIPKWRDRYLGKPASEKKSFPWPGAANTVVQVIGEKTDELVARVIGFIFATSPMWVFKYFALTDDPEMAEAKRKALEDFMDTVGYEQDCLDLYRINGQWFTDATKLGTAFVKALLEDRVEQVVVGYKGNSQTVEFDETTIYKGPKVVKLRHEDVLMNPAAQTVADSRMVAHRRILSRYDLELRAFQGIYDKDKVDAILKSPDRSGPDTTERREEDSKGVHSTNATSQAEWDIWECYFPWFHAGKVFRLIYSYHLASRTTVRSVFNFVPKNETPIVRAKMGYRNDLAYGHGFGEILNSYQEEVTTTHNQRLDNATAANVRAVRISPQARALDSNMELTPWGAIPGNKDDIEAIQMADVYPSTFQNEQLTLELADKRAGVMSGISGQGSGGVGKNKAYSSGGTLAVLQEGNHRTNLVTADFRHAHQKLGSLLASLYGKFGTGGQEQMLGQNAEHLKAALAEFLANKVRIPIRASNASINREIEKQNDMLMVGLMQRHYTGISQMMQAIENPQLPPPMKMWLKDVIRSSDLFIKRVLKDFGYDQPEEFVPEPDLEEPNAPQQQVAQPVQQPGGMQGTPQLPGMAPAGGGPQDLAAQLIGKTGGQ